MPEVASGTMREESSAISIRRKRLQANFLQLRAKTYSEKYCHGMPEAASGAMGMKIFSDILPWDA